MPQDTYVRLPNGAYIRFPAGVPPQKMAEVVRQQSGSAAARPGVPGVRPVDMKESKVPGAVRTATGSLPVVGGLGGAVLGAPAGPLGGLAGGGLGAAGGEAARRAANKALFGDDPGTIKEQLKGVGAAGAVGAASEIPGAAASAVGERLLARIAESKSPKEVGDVVAAMLKERPAGFSFRGFQSSLVKARQQVSEALGRVFSTSSGRVAAVQPALANARLEAQIANATVPGTLRKFDRIIEAAKYNAGIRGNSATADQLFKFQQELARPAYTGNPGPVAEVLSNLLKKSYTSVGQQVRSLAPASDTLLSRLTNLHAAESAVAKYHPNWASATAVTARLHPRTTAVLSPAVAAVTVAGASKASDTVKKIAQEAIP